MTIFISKVISFTWSSSFSEASVCAKIDRRGRELNTDAHGVVRRGGNRSVGLTLPIIERVRLAFRL